MKSSKPPSVPNINEPPYNPSLRGCSLKIPSNAFMRPYTTTVQHRRQVYYIKCHLISPQGPNEI